MKLTDFRTNRFLTKDDIPPDGTLATVADITSEDVSGEHEPATYKYAIHFAEFDRPLICNFTNAQTLADITGNDDEVEKHWVGAKVVIYVDPNVTMKGKKTGGIRLKAAPPETESDSDDAKQREEKLPF